MQNDSISYDDKDREPCEGPRNENMGEATATLHNLLPKN
jgi:hypothetical protein